jgi:peptide/nickel transport system substrate-binding protein
MPRTKTSRSKGWRHIVVLTLMALVIAACGGGDGGTGDGDGTTTTGASGNGDSRPAELITTHPQEPPNWDYWQTGATALTAPTYMNVIQSLLERQEDGSVEPLLAESWDTSDDGLEYTFHLREATFHDGTELDAADVVYSLLLNAESPNGNMSNALSVLESVEAVDDRTVLVRLAQPSQGFLQAVGMNSGIIVPEGFRENYQPESQMIGTGPYVFGEYRPDVDLVLERFDDYWGELPFFEKVTWRFIPDETAALNALEAGDVDMVGAVLGEGVDRIESLGSRDGFQVLLPAPNEQAYFYFNSEVEAFQDERVRQAIAHGIDRNAHLLAAVSGYGETNCVHAVPFSEPYRTDYCPYDYDPDRARELLAEAGYADGLEIEYKYLTIAEFPPMMEVFVDQMSTIGVTVTQIGIDLATWLEEVNTEARYEVSTITSGATLVHCRGGCRAPGFVDEEFESLMDQADVASTFEEWVDLRTRATNRLTDLAWTVPLWNKSTPTVARADLIGFKEYRTHLEMDLRNLRWSD